MVIVERSNGTYKYGLVSNFEDDDDGESRARALNFSALMFISLHVSICDDFFFLEYSSVHKYFLFSHVCASVCIGLAVVEFLVDIRNGERVIKRCVYCYHSACISTHLSRSANGLSSYLVTTRTSNGRSSTSQLQWVGVLLDVHVAVQVLSLSRCD